MIRGITPEEEQIIKCLLKQYPYEFFYYGSRAKGDFTKGSDLDILIKSDTEVSAGEIERLSIEFNESRLPYVVNFSDFNNISQEFYELIKNSLVRIEM